MHALLSDPIREFTAVFFDNMYYKNTSADVQKIISIVYRYMQESLDSSVFDEVITPTKSQKT
jgi:hypothetical protein